MYHRNLHRFSLFVSLSTLVLLLAGGMVTSTGSGLAVPDWPLSYGKLMPPMIGGIFYEHGHRLIASFVGFLTVVLTIWIVRKDQRSWVRKLAMIALVSVILQGLLGGLTVKLMLPPEVSVAHAALAQTFFCIVCSISLFMSRWWNSSMVAAPSAGALGTIRLSALLIVAVFIQLLLGAVVRHTKSGLAVPDVPLAYGQVLPSLTDDRVEEYNRQLIREDLRLFADGPVTKGQILIHVIHRYWGLALLCFGSWLSIRLWSGRSADKKLAILSMSLLAGLIIQILLGAFVVLGRKAPEIATLHQTTGAVLLMLCTISFLLVGRVQGKTNPHELRIFAFGLLKSPIINLKSFN